MKSGSQNPAAAATYRFDCVRTAFYGILEAGWTTFALVICIRYFDAPETIKAFIAGAGPIGLLLTPVGLYLAARMALRPSRACGLIFLLCACLLLGASLVDSLLLFTLFTVGSQMVAVQHNTLILHVYSENYAPHERGQRIALPLVLLALSAVTFALIGGRLLDDEIGYFRLLFQIMAAAALGAAWAGAKIPSTPLSTQHVGNPWQNLSLVWKDPFFGYILGTWTLLGLGNLIINPIRIEYLANAEYGINAENTTIALLLLVIPSISRVLSTRLWGRIFDKVNFVTTRNLLNLFFATGILLFFFTTNLILQGIAMACVGIAMGGGKIMWNLWVTKIAPPEKASSYMSIHMALTGVRGTLAPFLGYWLLSRSSPASVATIGFVLVLISSLLFEAIRHHPRLRTRQQQILTFFQ